MKDNNTSYCLVCNQRFDGGGDIAREDDENRIKLWNKFCEIMNLDECHSLKLNLEEHPVILFCSKCQNEVVHLVSLYENLLSILENIGRIKGKFCLQIINNNNNTFSSSLAAAGTKTIDDNNDSNKNNDKPVQCSLEESIKKEVDEDKTELTFVLDESNVLQEKEENKKQKLLTSDTKLYDTIKIDEEEEKNIVINSEITCNKSSFSTSNYEVVHRLRKHIAQSFNPQVCLTKISPKKNKKKRNQNVLPDCDFEDKNDDNVETELSQVYEISPITQINTSTSESLQPQPSPPTITPEVDESEPDDDGESEEESSAEEAEDAVEAIPKSFPWKIDTETIVDLGNGEFSLSNQMFMLTPNKEWQCCTCLKITVNRTGMIHHIRGIHLPKQQKETFKVNCRICSRDFIGLAAFKNHQKVHQRNPNRQYCAKPGSNGRVFIYSGKWEFEHLTEPVGKKHYICKTCGSLNSNLKYILRHIRYGHQEAKSCHCNKCGQAFKHQYNLAKHLRRTNCLNKPRVGRLPTITHRKTQPRATTGEVRHNAIKKASKEASHSVQSPIVIDIDDDVDDDDDSPQTFENGTQDETITFDPHADPDPLKQEEEDGQMQIDLTDTDSLVKQEGLFHYGQFSYVQLIGENSFRCLNSMCATSLATHEDMLLHIQQIHEQQQQQQDAIIS